MTQYRVVPADVTKDRQTILEIWRRNLSNVDRIEERFDWHFLRNPFGLGRSWILEADGHPAGTNSMGVRPVHLGTKAAMAGLSCDMAVDAQHRLLHPALLLQHAVMGVAGESTAYVYGVPNWRHGGVLLRAGYQEHCEIHRYAKPIQVSDYLKRNKYLNRLAPVLGGPTDIAWQAVARLRSARSYGWRTEELSEFDERFDDLWDRLKADHPLATVRSSSFLRWRYQQCPSASYTTVGLLEKDGDRLLGYLTYFVCDNHALCADLFTPGYGKEMRVLLGAWFRHASQRKVASLSIACSGPAALIAGLTRFGFTRRSVSAPAVQNGKPVRTDHEISKILLAHPCPSVPSGDANVKWYYTAGDSPYI